MRIHSLLQQGCSQKKFPLVLDLAASGIPVAVACRVLGVSKQALCAWKSAPVTERDWSDAPLINVPVDVRRDDPAFGYRPIADELEDHGFSAGENRVARLCSSPRIWSVFVEKRGRTTKARGVRIRRREGTPVTCAWEAKWMAPLASAGEHISGYCLV